MESTGHSIAPIIQFLQHEIERLRLVRGDRVQRVVPQNPGADVVDRRMNRLHVKLGKRLTPRGGQVDQTTAYNGNTIIVIVIPVTL